MSVAVVILNWNGKHFLQQFIPLILERTLELKSGSAVLYVADNGSTDGSVEWLEERCRESVRVIGFDRNYGFTGGYNRAFKEIVKREEAYDYYLLLNSDIEVTEGWLERLTEFMESHPECGACAPKIKSFQRREYFEHAGAAGGYVDHYYLPYCRGRVLDRVEVDRGQYDHPVKCFWVSGAAFMVRSEIWGELGGLDDSFFAHMEEIDLCWRMQLSGWEVWAVPDSTVFHVGGGTLPNNSPGKIYLNFRNNLLMMYKNLPPERRTLIIFERLFIDGCIAFLYTLQGRFSFVKMIFKAHKDYRKMKVDITRSEMKCILKRPSEMLPLLVMKRRR